MKTETGKMKTETGKMKTETEIQNEIRIELSKTGIVIRQQSGIFDTPYGGKVKVGMPRNE